MEKYTTNQLLTHVLEGFESQYAAVNGTQLHYVIGGEGEPLLLIPGYPETWWAYHKIMPILAEKYQVIVVEIRGMGNSAKPLQGYEKKNMARDIEALTQQLGVDRVYIGGHDIGAHVAFSFACNYPHKTAKLVMLDTPHPDAGMYHLPMLPIPGGNYTYPWWLAFNQVKELPEQLLEGRMDIIIDWLFDQLTVDKEAVSDVDRKLYTQAYNSKDAIRASNAWYQAFGQDIEDSKTYVNLSMPVLGIGGSGYEILQGSLVPVATNLKLVQIPNCGHFIVAEKPNEVAKEILAFLAEGK
ncbi:alpha/beta hydrolase [Myroides odoratus]|uniref:alpha/beta fold hydrolase n=1 Tax=Myroides odoratus TaxID=256 RepID=UPI00333FEF3A